MALLLVGLGFVDRLYCTEPKFNLLAPQQILPDTSIPVGSVDGNCFDPMFTSGSSIGSIDAPITMIIYSDFLCFSCQQLALSTEKEIIEHYVYTGKVRLVYKHFLTHGQSSILAAQAAECAAAHNKFWDFHDTLMARQLSVNEITIEVLQQIAGEIGLDPVSFSKELNSGKYKDQVIQEDQKARELGVSGSPTYYINRLKGKGYQPFEAFQRIFEELLRETTE
jgi:protein-disulfide isomerase